MLLGLLLLFHLLQFAPLAFDLLLLLLHLALSLLLLHFLVLHRVADRIAADGAQAAADRRPCAGMPDGRANYRAGAGTQQATTKGAFLTGA
ncbi:MAG TPA: hypothetical protein VN754_02125 [Candidatus Binataceae bacterium]|nr:hypothetical protein [Candidatus Binataceae bacterium]